MRRNEQKRPLRLALAGRAGGRGDGGRSYVQIAIVEKCSRKVLAGSALPSGHEVGDARGSLNFLRAN
jgi:hypothetical protein